MENPGLEGLKVVNVPRLELMAAIIVVKVCAFICRELVYDFDCVILWADAMIALQYVRNTSTRFHMFVANRFELRLFIHCQRLINDVMCLLARTQQILLLVDFCPTRLMLVV